MGIKGCRQVKGGGERLIALIYEKKWDHFFSAKKHLMLVHIEDFRLDLNSWHVHICSIPWLMLLWSMQIHLSIHWSLLQQAWWRIVQEKEALLFSKSNMSSLHPHHVSSLLSKVSFRKPFFIPIIQIIGLVSCKGIANKGLPNLFGARVTPPDWLINEDQIVAVINKLFI